MSGYTIRPAGPADRELLAALLREHLGSEEMAIRGELYRLTAHRALLAEEDGEVIGMATYAVAGAACELLSLDSLREGRGVGGALLEAVAGAARAAGCMWLQLITTNDNLHALGFYQRRGFRIVGVSPGAVDRARASFKPSIPAVAANGIPIRDEIELVRELG